MKELTRSYRALLGVYAALFAICGVTQPLLAQDQATYSGGRALVVHDLARIKSVGSVEVSPDGEWVAYVVTTTNLDADGRESRIWMVATAGGESIPMTVPGASASNPQWSPDGRYLSYVGRRGEAAATQVYVLDRRGGEARSLTEVPNGVSGYEWSPDGTRLVLGIADPEPEEDSDGGYSTPEPWVVDRLQFKEDGSGYVTASRYTHLYVFDVTTKALTQITSGTWDDHSPSWSPDGTSIAFVSNRTEDPDVNTNSDIWVVAADNTDKGANAIRITDYEGSDDSPAWSPDGRWIAYTTGTVDPRFEAYSTVHLAVSRADGSGSRRILTEALDRNVYSPQFTPDGAAVLVRVTEQGRRHVARIDAATGEVTRPVDGEISVFGYSQGPDGMLATVISSFDSPGEVFLWNGSESRQITHVNDSLFGTIGLAEVRNLHFRSAEDTEIEGWAYFPPGHQIGARHPTILLLHGGPNGLYGVEFNFEAQLFAADGYLVLLTNPRGSSGYGWEFGSALWQNWGTPDYEDVMAGVDYVIGQGWVDPDRLGVGGYSYGGMLTNYVITKTTRFKGAVSGAGWGLLRANFGVDQNQLDNEREWGLPWENRQRWEDHSPFNHVDMVTTPTLFMGGERDWRVPIMNSEQMFLALKRRGIDTRLVVYPGQSHYIGLPSYQVHRYTECLAWYDKYVKGEVVTGSANETNRRGRRLPPL